MSIEQAMHDACRSVGIVTPRRVAPGRWVPTPVEGKGRGNGSGRVRIFEDGHGGVAWNWVTGESITFRAEGAQVASRRLPRRRAEDREEAGRRKEAARIAEMIVRAARAEEHPYLAAKGFPDECGLVIDEVRALLPASDLGRAIARQAEALEGPLLVVPGRIGRHVTTVQMITPAGTKKNLLGGQIGGASHRIASGRETWVCEGIATALTVRAALRLLGRSATVLAAFSAANVAKVAKNITGAVIAADHDKPLEHLSGRGAGEHHARATGCRWCMPPERGDWNDYHQAHGLRAVAMLLREVPP